MDISPIFNIVDTFEYFELDDESTDNLDYPKNKANSIEMILNSRINKCMRGKDCMEYLVQWKDKPAEDNSWITQAELDFYDSSQTIKDA